MPLPKADRAWLFDHGTWGEDTEDIYSRAGEEDQPDLSTAFRQAGYDENPIIQLGSTEHGFSVEVYESANGRGNVPIPRTPYFINVMIGSNVECIYVTDFPSFVMLMDQLSAITRSIFSDRIV